MMKMINPWTFPNYFGEDEYMLIGLNKNEANLTYPRTLINQGDTI